VNRWWTVARAFSNTAHGVNNALQVVSGNAELLESADGMAPAVLKRVQAIRAQSGRAATSIDGLLSYARGMAQPPSTIDLGRVLDSALEMRAHSLSRARITVAMTRPEEGSCLLVAPPGKLLQLMLNLLLMIEAELSGRPDARIGIAVERVPSRVRLNITAAGALQSAAQGPSPDWFLGFEKGAHERVVLGLASRMAGTLRFERVGEAIRKLELELPAVSK
jgi:C4-dicarboxylate-specific signal transduction histidine kinase